MAAFIYLLPRVGDGASDELFHDFIGAAVDGLHPRVHEGLADGVLPHVAPPAVKLHPSVGHRALQVGAPVLGHRGHGRVELVLGVQVDALVHESPPHAHFRLHLRQLVAHLEIERGEMEVVGVV